MPQHALGGAGFFDLGNHSGLSGCNFGAHRTHKIAGQHAGLGVCAHQGQGFAVEGGGDFFAFDGDDLVEDIGHWEVSFSCCDRDTSCVSLSLAAPDSIAARARSIPAAMVSTTLAA